MSSLIFGSSSMISIFFMLNTIPQNYNIYYSITIIKLTQLFRCNNKVVFLSFNTVFRYHRIRYVIAVVSHFFNIMHDIRIYHSKFRRAFLFIQSLHMMDPEVILLPVHLLFKLLHFNSTVLILTLQGSNTFTHHFSCKLKAAADFSACLFGKLI